MKYFISLILFFCFTAVNAQDFYAQEWAKIDSLKELGENRSAYERLQTLQNRAKAENNQPQFLKILLNKAPLTLELEENQTGVQQQFGKMITELKTEAETGDEKLRPMLHSILGEFYWNYFNQNRWQILNRTSTNIKADDIQTWDTKKLMEAAAFHYRKSVADEESIQKIPVAYYRILIEHENPKLRPSLFDLLVHRAIQYFSDESTGLSSPKDQFAVANTNYFVPARNFVALDLPEGSVGFDVLKMYQQLLKYRLKDDNAEALADADFGRIQFLEQHAVFPDKNTFLMGFWQDFANVYKNTETYVPVLYKKAALHQALGGMYNPEDPKQLYKDELLKAKALLKDLVEKYPNHRIAPEIRNTIHSLDARNVEAIAELAVVPDKNFPISVIYRNTNKLYFRIAKVTADDYLRIEEKEYHLQTKWFNEKLQSANVIRFEANVPDDGDLQSKTAQIIAPALPFGTYVIYADYTPEFKPLNHHGNLVSWIQASDISVISRLINNQRQLSIVNRTTGRPIPQAKVTNLGNNDFQLTPQDGEVKMQILNNYRRNGYKIEWGGQKFIEKIYDYERREYNDTPQYQVHFFTDRTIYRPGQTVYFKGILLENEGQNQKKVKTDFAVKIGLFNANNEQKGDLQLTTNENGSFHGEFKLPEDGLMGNFHIREIARNISGVTSFSVEEYKRPKFVVEKVPVEGTPRLGEMVNVKVKAASYAGAPIGDAEVKFKVTRGVQMPRWCWWWNPQPPTQIAFGTVKTGQDGVAEISFLAKPDPTILAENFPQFTYTITTDVTDISGETRSLTSTVNLAYQSFQLQVNIDDEVMSLESPKVSVVANNFSGSSIENKGKLTVSKIPNPSRIIRTLYWAKSHQTAVDENTWKTKLPFDWYNEKDLFKLEGEKIFEANYDTKGEGVQLPRLAQGYYMIKAVTQDENGKTVETKGYFTRILPQTGATLPQEVTFKQLNPTVEVGNTAKFLIGSAYENVRVRMDIEELGKIVKTEYIILNNSQRLIEIPVEERHRGNFSVHFGFVRHNRKYAYSTNVGVLFSNKDLELSTEVFRDKLYPGQAEEWRLKIRGKNGEKVAAELLATLYDASLDAFGRPNNYAMNLWTYRGARFVWESNTFSINHLYNRENPIGENPNSPILYPSLNIAEFGLSGYGYYGYDMYSRRSPRMMMDAVAMPSGAPPPPPAPMAEMAQEREMGVGASFNIQEGVVAKIQGADAGQAPQNPNLDNVTARKNLNETAFFFPQLKTDENGNVVLSFTMPEALTKWKFLALAHNPDMQVGTITKEVVTQKDLMLSPSVPRFLRENDQMQLVAKIDNLTENVQKGEARLQLFNALNNEPVDALFALENATTAFEAPAKGSTIVKWTIKVPQTVSAVRYKMVAASGTFSDGEENVLPIVPNRMLVTESLPLPVRGAGTTNFKFDKLLNNQSTTLQHHALTVEFTPNPVWYAVQALPYLSEFPYECAEQTFTRYFANRLSRHIIDKNPRIKDVFERWKNESPESFLSKLEQNQELKNAILSETPWVMEAANESERKKRIALLFDVRRMSTEENRALTRLLELQNEDGGWSWFKGMESNSWMTQHIATGFGQLRKLGVDLDPRVTQSMNQAVNYVDNYWVEEYRKHKADWEQYENVGALHWLYMRSFFTDIELSSPVKEVLDFWLDKAEKHWLKLDIYSQGMASLALNRFNRQATAKQILVSLKQRSINSAEMGRYWNYQNGWYWYQAPVETHSLMIEAFHEINNDQEMVEDLKVWLLKNKQTNDWKTTKATAAAIYALLLRGSDLISQNQTVNIALGNYEVQPDKEEAGTGYFKKRIEGSDINQEMGNIKVEKTGQSVAWGAVYWQYFEQLDKITVAATPLSIEKKLFKEVMTDEGAVLEPLNNHAQLKVGDRVKVRVIIRTDRDMEYVHLKDMRASGFEPENVLSGYRWQDGLGYYESTKDLATHFFIDWLRKGTYVLEYPVRVTHTGEFSNGITTLQCMYAPEFSAHSEGIRVVVE